MIGHRTEKLFSPATTAPPRECVPVMRLCTQCDADIATGLSAAKKRGRVVVLAAHLKQTPRTARRERTRGCLRCMTIHAEKGPFRYGWQCRVAVA